LGFLGGLGGSIVIDFIFLRILGGKSFGSNRRSSASIGG
jgi:hypothetical protein